MKNEKSEFIEKVKTRTKQLAVDLVLFYDQMKKTDSTRIMGKQMIRSVTSTAANYRAACVARSQREFFQKYRSSLKKQMKPYSGWKCFKILN